MTPPKQSEPLDRQAEVLAEEFRRAISTFVRTFREKTHTEKSAQDEALILLERDGAMNVTALAQRRNVTHQTMRLVVGQLENAGLIKGEPDPSDRRSTLFCLSDTGRSALQHSRATRASKIGNIIENTLSAEDRQTLAASIALMDRMSDAAQA